MKELEEKVRGLEDNARKLMDDKSRMKTELEGMEKALNLKAEEVDSLVKVNDL